LLLAAIGIVISTHGGVKVFCGTAAAARNYVEADRSHADDYDLAEGTGIASRFTTKRDGRVIELASLTGDRYEAWVAGLDPDSGEPRGRLRPDAHGVAGHRGRRERTQIGRCGVQRRLDGADQRATRWPTAASGPLACRRTWQPDDGWLAGATAAVTDKRPFPIRIDFLGNAL
jgi:hypothetical protein